METTNELLTRNKIRSFVKLVQYARQTQQEYFESRRRHDEITAQRKLIASKALEKRVDEACLKMHELLDTHFQPELFK